MLFLLFAGRVEHGEDLGCSDKCNRRGFAFGSFALAQRKILVLRPESGPCDVPRAAHSPAHLRPLERSAAPQLAEAAYFALMVREKPQVPRAQRVWAAVLVAAQLKDRNFWSIAPEVFLGRF